MTKAAGAGSGTTLWSKLSSAIGRADKNLPTLFSRQIGKPSAKWQGYLPHYERWFAKFEHQPIALLEIGVQAGGSLEIWAEHFGQAQHIIGCDIDRACAMLQYRDPRIEVVIGNVNDAQTLSSIQAISPTLDIVVDDGSHQSRDIIQSFLSLFPSVSQTGIYVIEDLHCSYWGEYGGGLYHPQSAIAFFKKIIDIINQPNWGVDVEPSVFFKEFEPAIQALPNPIDWQLLRDIHSIEFANSMCVVQKRPAAQNGTGRLILSGAKSGDGASAHHYQAQELTVPNQSTNVSSSIDTANDSTENQLLKAFEEIDRLKQENLRLTTEFYESTKRFYDASVKIQELEQQLQQQTQQQTQQPLQQPQEKT